MAVPGVHGRTPLTEGEGVATVAVPALREVAPPPGGGWMRLADAKAAGVDMGYVHGGIGPRERGVVYLCAYWRTSNIVHDVFVRVTDVRRRGRTFRRAVSWEVAEESVCDFGRVRRHMTSWTYDTRNRVLRTLTD